jgi:hypothetical protein
MDPKELGSTSHEKQNKKNTKKTYLLKIFTKAIVLSNKGNDFVVITYR